MRAALAAVAEGKLVRFDRFMETVLYHPELGYYARNPERAGRQGDFITSPEVAPLFGETLARWVSEVWTGLGAPAPFHLIEVGAGRGTLATSILDAIPATLAQSTVMHLVEAGSAPRAALAARFSGDSRVHVHSAVSQLPATLGPGFFLANELFDNLPVRRVMKADGWKEIHVRLEGKRLREELAEAPPDLVGVVQAARLEPGEGQTVEVRETAVPLLEAVLSRLTSGAFAIFDYGGEANEVSGEAAPNGTLAAHRGHATHPDVYAAIGEQDITAHVNFTPLRMAAEALGWSPARLVTQSRFLVEHGLPERFVARIEAEPDAFERLKLTQYSKQLYHPEAMGGAFRVLYAMKRQ